MEIIYGKSFSMPDIKADDCLYDVVFEKIMNKYRDSELEPMSDSLGQRIIDSGKMRVTFRPCEATMVFKDDIERKRTYKMTVEKARELWKLLKTCPKYWFALDMASYYAK